MNNHLDVDEETSYLLNWDVKTVETLYDNAIWIPCLIILVSVIGLCGVIKRYYHFFVTNTAPITRLHVSATVIEPSKHKTFIKQ